MLPRTSVSNGVASAAPALVVRAHSAVASNCLGPPARELEKPDLRYEGIKRALDLAGAILGLILLSPLLCSLALSIFVTSGRPVLIRQRRVGRWERPFWLYKFRTLPVSELQSGDVQWCVPPGGTWSRVMRSLGLDELPQLWNVLRGDMSLVGPRPERPHFVEQFRRRWPDYSERHSVHVGITGWAQVHGFRGDTSIPARLRLDIFYLRNWSLRLDALILWLTLTGTVRTIFRSVVRHKGYADG
jgi:lipopolysaccharide/colanic/teichoic acid biosynthesis glycosyltransferase